MLTPEIISLGPLSIRWYGVCAAAGLLSAYLLQKRRAKRYQFNDQEVADLTFCCMLGGIVGARTAYVLRFWQQEFAGQSLLEIVKIYNGGLVFYGGFLGAVLTGFLLCRRRHWSWGKASDLVTPALPLAHACGRIGCLITGCCFGLPYSGPLCVDYGPHAYSVLHVQKALHLLPPEATYPLTTFPLEAVAALLNLCLCAILLWSEKRGWAKNRLFFLYGILYSAARFCLEFGRGDYLQRWHGLTPAQTTCLWLFPLACLAFAFLTCREKRRNPQT